MKLKSNLFGIFSNIDKSKYIKCYTSLPTFHDNEIEDDFEKIIDMIDKEKFGPSDETDPPGWESDTRYEKEIRIGKVKKGGKLGPGKRIERVILKKKKPFGKNDSRPGDIFILFVVFCLNL
ncbi:unnamed protein product [Schistosoma mattheei]|uniref:Uncharacterized protein n=1 Tax=Schistosoma mattheei TaxID=31246 RepID=A0AA85BR50_9TREM|nr:unnamed protein product [Schistosoma mattheei]